MTEPQFIVLLARNAQQAREWCRGQGLAPYGRDIYYASSARALEGCRPSRIVQLPGFSERRDADQIMSVAKRSIAHLQGGVVIEEAS